MKHIIICLVCAVLLFSYIGQHTVTQDMITSAAPGANVARVAAAATTAKMPDQGGVQQARMTSTSAMQQVGILLAHTDDLGTARFKNTFEKNLSPDVKINSVDCAGSAETKKTMFDKMVKSAYSLIVLELAENEPSESFIDAAGQAGIPMIIIGNEPQKSLLTKYPNIYYMGFSNDDIVRRMADETYNFWVNNPIRMDFEEDEWDLSYSAITSKGFVGNGSQDAFQSAMNEKGVSTKLEVDSIVQAYEYNLHKEIDQTIIKDSELVFYDSSIEAQKAINYYYDPTEFKKRPKQQLALSIIDDGAAKLVEDGEVLFACGTDPTELGRVAARLAGLLMTGQTPSFQTMEIEPTAGQSFYLPITVLRAPIEPEPIEEDTEK